MKERPRDRPPDKLGGSGEPPVEAALRGGQNRVELAGISFHTKLSRCEALGASVSAVSCGGGQRPQERLRDDGAEGLWA